MIIPRLGLMTVPHNKKIDSIINSIDVDSIGISELPVTLEERVLKYLRDVNEYDDGIWCTRNSIGKGIGSSNVGEVLKMLVDRGSIVEARHGVKKGYKISS